MTPAASWPCGGTTTTRSGRTHLWTTRPPQKRLERLNNLKAQELCRRYGISDATFYKYKAKFGGMNVSDAKKLRALEDANNKLKRMLADAMLDNAALKDLATKNY